ncbi:MAG: acyl-CoA thioesterase, partial [Bacteroidia bacterium]|nr:acyl-CoA thioesterase [Bacteroidia bacterium]
MKKLIELKNQIEVPIRFHEVDAMNIVWHGHYLKYFELGREALALEHGFSYLSVYELGYMTPIVKSTCEHKSSLTYGDVAIIETTWTETHSAKLVFTYKIFKKSDFTLCAKG